MYSTGVQGIEIVFLLLLVFVVVFGVLAKRLAIAYPIVLVIGGLLVSFIPGVPKITLNADLVFFVILPPLLYSAAWLTSWREFSYNLISILLLAFGLVFFTVLGVTHAARWLLPGFDWRVGLALGAVLAPTDAIAATSISRRLGLPKRMVDILEGESLLNDASALLALEFAIGLLVSGHVPTFAEGFLRLCYLIVAGVAVGLVGAEIVHQLEHRIDDAPIEISLSILTPYVLYLAADFIHASGVLAVVASGLYLSRKSSHFFSPAVRLQAWAVWDSLTFILNGLVFVLMGLQLPYVIGSIHDGSLRRLILSGLAISGLLILLRLVWTFPGAFIANRLRRKIFDQHERLPPARQIFIVGWTGMRGVVSLAAAIALPETLANGVAFTQRYMIIFLAFSVILVTLVLQGLTLPPLIRALKVGANTETETEERDARRVILQAALDHLEKTQSKSEPEMNEVFSDLAQHYRHRLANLSEECGDGPNKASQRFYRHFNQLSLELLRVERQTAVRLRNQGRIGDELLRQIEREIDLGEARVLTKARG